MADFEFTFRLLESGIRLLVTFDPFPILPLIVFLICALLSKSQKPRSQKGAGGGGRPREDVRGAAGAVACAVPASGTHADRDKVVRCYAGERRGGTGGGARADGGASEHVIAAGPHHADGHGLALAQAQRRRWRSAIACR